MTAIGTVILVARVTLASPVMGIPYMTNAILSVVVGGTALLGGKGSVLWTVLGTLLLILMGNCLNLMGVSTYIQYMLKGAILILAIWLDNRKQFSDGDLIMITNIKGYITKILSLQKAFLAILLVIFVLLRFNLNEKTHTEFFTSYNFVDLLKSNSIYLILAMGETIVLVAGGVDLSIGGVMTVSGIMAILLINSGVPIPIAVMICILFGVVVGAINAYISVYQKTEPFIITLGMGVLLTGVAQQLTNAHPVSVDFSKSENFLNLANYELFGQVPVLVIVMAVVLAVMYWTLRSTSFGRNCYAIGGDYEVAKYSGINVLQDKL